MVLTPKALQKDYRDLYYKIQPLLGVTGNTGKEWRTLPERYQGLGLPDFKVHALSKKVHFLQQKWDGNASTSKMDETTYEAFVVDVGIYDNTFSRSWEELKVLATKHTWYYNLCELCHNWMLSLIHVKRGNVHIHHSRGLPVLLEKSQGTQIIILKQATFWTLQYSS